MSYPLSRNPRARQLVPLAALAVLFAGTADCWSQTTIIVNDTFTDGDRNNDGSFACCGIEQSSGTPDTLDIPWFRITGSGHPSINSDFKLNNDNGEASVGVFYDVVGNGSTASPQYDSQAAFPSATLGANVGDKLRFSADIQVLGNNGNSSGRRSLIGLLNSNGTQLTGDNDGTNLANDFGYLIRLDHDDDSPGAQIIKVDATDTDKFHPNNNTTLANNGDFFIPAGTDASNELKFVMELERLATGVELSVLVDDGTDGTTPITSLTEILNTTDLAAFTTFDQIGVFTDGTNPGINLDNVLIEQVAAQVPEPSTYVMFLLIGAVALLVGRRLQRRTR